MNILLFDIGNTRIKSRLLFNESSLDIDPVSHDGNRSGAILEVMELVKERMAGSVLDRIHVASVLADKAIREMTSVLGKYCADVVVHRAAAEMLGVRNSYKEPARLGVDRWLAMLAAYNKFGGPVCVADCGSAITIDVIDASGQHLGGYIIPGQQMMVGSLLSGTGQIKVSDTKAGCSAEFGTNTTDAVIHGAFYANVSIIKQAMVDIAAKLNDTCTLVLTGGDGASLLGYMGSGVCFEQALVLDGLQECAQAIDNLDS